MIVIGPYLPAVDLPVKGKPVNLTMLATKELKSERLDICAVCPERRNLMCKKCGCLLQLKTQFRSSQCPIGKW